MRNVNTKLRKPHKHKHLKPSQILRDLIHSQPYDQLRVRNGVVPVCTIQIPFFLFLFDPNYCLCLREVLNPKSFRSWGTSSSWLNMRAGAPWEVKVREDRLVLCRVPHARPRPQPLSHSPTTVIVPPVMEALLNTENDLFLVDKITDTHLLTVNSFNKPL